MEKIFDLKKRSYVYAVEVARFLREMPKDYISQTLGKQLIRSATSVGANIMEAQSSSSRKDFINFYTHSLKSANESKFWFHLSKETEEISKILASSILSLKGKKNF